MINVVVGFVIGKDEVVCFWFDNCFVIIFENIDVNLCLIELGVEVKM